MTQAKRRVWWGDYRTTEYASIDPEATIAVLPVSAIEQHGPHLPVSTDTTIMTGMLETVIAHLPADRAVFRHVRRDHHRVGTGLERLEHRHGRADAGEPGDIAAGGDDAARAAADDDRAVEKLRPVALLDAGIEGVAVEMSEGERRELGMG